MFKVMTWNVENLFKAGHASGPQTQAAYDDKIRGLASVINDQAPDALAVQEIGDPTTLDDLVKHLHGGRGTNACRSIPIREVFVSRGSLGVRSWRPRISCSSQPT